jgi:hypothetical protein
MRVQIVRREKGGGGVQEKGSPRSKDLMSLVKNNFHLIQEDNWIKRNSRHELLTHLITHQLDR